MIDLTNAIRSLLARLSSDRAGYLDALHNAKTTGSHNITVANDTAETDVFSLAKTAPWGLSVYLDLASLVAAVEGGTITVRYYMKVDESNYAQIGKSEFIVGTDTVMPSCEVIRGNHGFKATIQCSTNVTDTRAVPYVYILSEE